LVAVETFRSTEIALDREEWTDTQAAGAVEFLHLVIARLAARRSVAAVAEDGVLRCRGITAKIKKNPCEP
jgi:hypothetical protein